eukprot:1161454-Pelagomonas_calceolata.AAC.8
MLPACILIPPYRRHTPHSCLPAGLPEAQGWQQHCCHPHCCSAAVVAALAAAAAAAAAAVAIAAVPAVAAAAVAPVPAAAVAAALVAAVAAAPVAAAAATAALAATASVAVSDDLAQRAALRSAAPADSSNSACGSARSSIPSGPQATAHWSV